MSPGRRCSSQRLTGRRCRPPASRSASVTSLQLPQKLPNQGEPPAWLLLSACPLKGYTLRCCKACKLPSRSCNCPVRQLLCHYWRDQTTAHDIRKRRQCRQLKSSACREATRHLHLHFLRTPLEVLPRSPGCPAVGGVELELNKLEARGDGSQAAVGLGQHETLPVRSRPLWHTALQRVQHLPLGSQSCWLPTRNILQQLRKCEGVQSAAAHSKSWRRADRAGVLQQNYYLQADMVLSSIGYRSEAIEGVAFDARLGVVMHRCCGSLCCMLSPNS